MKSLLRVAIVFSAVALSAAPASACFCLIPEVPEAFERASAVFVGEVVEIVVPGTSDENARLPGRFFVVKFKVEKAWKGVGSSQEIKILSAQGRYGCFAHPPVNKGERYLIYANSFYGICQGDWLVITSCSRTALITETVMITAFQAADEHPTAIKAHLSLQLPAGVDVADDLRQIEALLHPRFRFDIEPVRKPVDSLRFLNFMEPAPGTCKK